MTGSAPDDLNGMLAGISRIQRDLEAAQADAAAAYVTGTAGGGAVTVRVSGEFSFEAIKIATSVVASGDAGVIEDLVLAAVRNAVSQLLEQRKAAIGSLMYGALGSLFASGDEGPEIAAE